VRLPDRAALSLPAWLQPAAVVAILAVGLAAFSESLTQVHLQLLMLAAVLLSALGLGLAVGLSAATCGFAVLLWRGMQTAPGLDLRTVLDAFLWFAVAKLTASLVALPRRHLRRQTTARQQAETELQQHGLLLDEMSHRVGNDMQRLVGILQAEAVNEPLAASALQRAASRILVLGRLHRRLSLREGEGETEAVVDSRVFLEGLADDLRGLIDRHRPVALTVAAETHELPVRRAADLGLVVNELVTNALKHGFPAGSSATAGAVIRIDFHREGGSFDLTVTDNGVGLAASPKSGGLGQRLVRALATQLGGRLETLQSEVGGTRCRLIFPVEPPALIANTFPVAPIFPATSKPGATGTGGSAD
jgi:two-component sensor histidine kinase